jgi:hypothetical protein
MKTNWKMYVSLALYIVLGVAAGYLVARGVRAFMNSRIADDVKVVNEEKMGTKTFSGDIYAVFEGTSTAKVTFDYDAAYTVEQGTGNRSRYFVVKNASGTLATIYASYEGGRGYSAADYLAETISKAVPTVSAPTTAVYGDASWMTAGTAMTEWHIAPQKNGEWLLVVESKKSNNKEAGEILKTLTIK